MQHTVASDQQKFFRQNGYIAFDDLLTSHDRSILRKEIAQLLQQSPGYTPENLSRSMPHLFTVIRLRQLAVIAAQLLKKKPLRLAHDQFFASAPTLNHPLDEEECGLLLPLNGKGEVLYFKDSLPQSELYKTPEACYLLLVFSAKPLSNELNPVVYK